MLIHFLPPLFSKLSNQRGVETFACWFPSYEPIVETGVSVRSLQSVFAQDMKLQTSAKH